MIQRIQTIYLLSASILLIILQFVPLASFTSADAGAILYTGGYSTLASGNAAVELPLALAAWIAPLLLGAAALCSFITLFLFRKRRLQMRFCILDLLLTLSTIVVLAVQAFHLASLYTDMQFTLSCLLFLVALLLQWMARRRIAKDEALVRSLDRIR